VKFRLGVIAANRHAIGKDAAPEMVRHGQITDVTVLETSTLGSTGGTAITPTSE